MASASCSVLFSYFVYINSFAEKLDKCIIVFVCKFNRYLYIHARYAILL